MELVREITSPNGKLRVHPCTVRRILQRHARVARKKPLLSVKNVQHRLKWAKARRSWTYADWSRVVWSDESTFRRFNSSRQHVRRRKGEALRPDCVIPTVKFGGGKVSAWRVFMPMELDLLSGLMVI